MVKRLLSGILTTVFVPLGLTFTVLGLVLEDGGGFLAVGLPLLAVGLAFATLFGLSLQREAARRRHRREGLRAPAEVVAAKLNAGIRVGVYLAYDLTVVIAGQTVSRRVLVVPGTELEPGGMVEVLYDPADPANFEVAR